MIHYRAIWDDGELFVCGSFWPGAYDGAPPPDWLPEGGAPVRDLRAEPVPTSTPEATR